MVQMYVDLWEGDDDPIRREEFVDTESDVTEDCRSIRTLVIANPETNFEDQCAVAKILEVGDRCRMVDRTRVLRRGLDEQTFDLADGRTVSDTNGDSQSHPWILMGPVDDIRFEEGRVWHDDVEIVRCADSRAAEADRFDRTDDACDFDEVADSDRPLGKQ